MFSFIRNFFIRRRLRKSLRIALNLQKWMDNHPREDSDMSYNDYLRKHYDERLNLKR